MTTDRTAYSRDWMRLKRAKERIPKLEAELQRLRELIEKANAHPD
jgi:hypothetical protein